MENVSQLILLIVIKKDVKHGKMENVLNVQKDGSLMLMVFVKKLVISVGHGLTMENAKAVIKDTSSMMESVKETQMHLMDRTILYAQNGNGMIDNV